MHARRSLSDLVVNIVLKLLPVLNVFVWIVLFFVKKKKTEGMASFAFLFPPLCKSGL